MLPPAISAVSTSITGFVGKTAQGPLNEAIAVGSMADYALHFGEPAKSPVLGRALSLFFANGGSSAHIVRVLSYTGPALKAGVACEPANHEFLDLTPDDTAFTNPDTQLRNIEEMQMRDPAFVRSRINEPLAFKRIEPISLPVLVMGRDDDHLQGIFRLSYDLLKSAGKDATWVSWDHPLHGYIFPVVGTDGAVEVDDVQERAIDGVIAFLDRHLAG